MTTHGRLRIVLVAIVAGIAFGFGVLVIALKRSHDENLCWRAFVEDGVTPPEGDCRRL